MTLRFHLDENVHMAVAAALRRRGIDVTAPSAVGLAGATDEQQLAFARRHGRVMVTHDTDFLRLAATGAEHAGIVFCHAHKRSLRQLVSVLSRLAVTSLPETVANRVMYV